jgi:hypothetical protein
MSRRSWSWCWAVALLVCLGPLATAHSTTIRIGYNRYCVREVGDSWEKKSSDGRFKLLLGMTRSDPRMAPVYELKLFRGSKPVSNMIFKDLVTKPYTWIAPDGRYVVLLRPTGELVLVNSEGQQRQSWDLRKHLSVAEKDRLPKDFCQEERWAQNVRFTGDTFEMEVPPTEVLGNSREPLKPFILRIDLKAERFEREGVVLNGGDAELVQSYMKAEAPEERLRFADELLGRSQIREYLKSRELNAFWNGLLRTPELKPKVLHRMAVEAVAAYGLESEVRGLARLPGEIEERDIAVLDVLERRFPDDAGEYALRLLETPHSSQAVRERALKFLFKSRTAEDMAVGFALSDSSRELRRSALPSLREKPFTPQRFQQVLEFCDDPDPSAQYGVTWFALRTPGKVEEAQRKEMLEAMRAAEPRWALGQCPEVSLAMGALREKEGNRGQALELYTRGLRGLEQVKKTTMTVSAQLRVDAMLQLGLEAEKRGERAEAERYARAVLADPSRREPVCIERAITDAVPWTMGDCLPNRNAEKAARELLKRLKSKPRGG